MKGLIKVFIFGSLQIVSVFVVPMFFTFFSEWISTTGFFGDAKCPDSRGCGAFDEGMSWGIRHHLYFWMCVVLFCANIMRAISMFVAYVDKIDRTDRMWS